MIRWRDLTLDRKRCSLAGAGTVVRLTRREYQIVEALICGAPKTTAELFDLIYRDDENGGPLSGVAVIGVYLCNVRRKLSPLGLVLGRSRETFCGRKRYWLEPGRVDVREAA